MNYNAVKLDRIYVKDIVRLHRVLVLIISDRGTPYTFNFWENFQLELGSRFGLRKTFDLKTNEQLEETIKGLEEFLELG